MTGSEHLGRSIYRRLSVVALVLCSTAVALIALELGLRIRDGQPLVPTVNFVDQLTYQPTKYAGQI
jgi:hypothetical protein